MSVAGYEKVKTKVIEGKKKCIYKKHKGTKLYVKGFGKMRSVESYVKLCKKAAASKASKPKKSKKTRSKSAKKYGGFLQEFFANMGEEGFSEKAEKNKDKFSTQPVNSIDVPKSHQEASPSPPPPPTPPSKTEGFNAHDQKIGGSSCSKKGGDGVKVAGTLKMVRNKNYGYNYYRLYDEYKEEQLEVDTNNPRTATNQYFYWKDPNGNTPLYKSEHPLDGAILYWVNPPASEEQDGGRRRKRNKVPKSMLDKLMMAATFRKRSVKKGKKYHRKGGNLFSNMGLMGGQSQTNY